VDTCLAGRSRRQAQTPLGPFLKGRIPVLEASNMTDQSTPWDRLAKAMTRVAEAEQHSTSQAALVAEMQRAGQDARRSIMILATLREAHDRFQQEVKHILEGLKRKP
jgi:DNA polymerase III delta prime subunit